MLPHVCLFGHGGGMRCTVCHSNSRVIYRHVIFSEHNNDVWPSTYVKSEFRKTMFCFVFRLLLILNEAN